MEEGKAELGDVVGKAWKQRLIRWMVAIVIIHLLSAFGGVGHGKFEAWKLD